MNYLTDWEKFTELYGLDWGKYNSFAYNSTSLQYFPEEQLRVNSKKVVKFFNKLEEEKVIYLPIPKNASTSIMNSINFTPIKTYFKEISTSYERENKDSINTFFSYIDVPEKYRQEYKFVIVTRDPKERWISGINEILNIYLAPSVRRSLLFPRYRRDLFNGDKELFRSKFLTELKNNKFIFDCHTKPQVSWINFCSQYNLDITFLKLDEHLDEKMSTLLKRKVEITHDNPSKKFKFKLKNYRFCHDILTNYCMKNKNFLDLYKMDFYLYNSSS